MEIYFTDRSAAPHVPNAERLPPGALRAFVGLDVPNRMPFFLDSDGSYPRLLNAFLRDLPVLGCVSPNTWRAYAMDVQGLLLHLEETGCPRSLLGLEFDDLRSYRDRRRNGTPPDASAATWNRCVAALEKFFDWAVEGDTSTRRRSSIAGASADTAGSRESTRCTSASRRTTILNALPWHTTGSSVASA